MNRNYTPDYIKPKKMQSIAMHSLAYSDKTRSEIAALLVPLTSQYPEYTNEWFFYISWETAGDRLHKRIANMVYKTCGVRLLPDVTNRIAEIASAERGRKLHFDVTRRFLWQPGDFGDNRSCYWGSYTEARVTYLPKLGTSCVRLYTQHGDGSYTGAGRFWLMPAPHMGKDKADAYIAFNFYGGFQRGENVPEVALNILGSEWEQCPFSTIMEMEGCYVNDNQVITFRRKGSNYGVYHHSISYADMMASTLPLPNWDRNTSAIDAEDEVFGDAENAEDADGQMIGDAGEDQYAYSQYDPVNAGIALESLDWQVGGNAAIAGNGVEI